MSCKCKTKYEVQAGEIPCTILPDEPCIFCAEKHFSTAFRLAEEKGYQAVNRQKIIGELVLAEWHAYGTHPVFAGHMRELRHLVQNRLQRKIRSEWENLCQEIEEIITQELSNDHKTLLVTGGPDDVK